MSKIARGGILCLALLNVNIADKWTPDSQDEVESEEWKIKQHPIGSSPSILEKRILARVPITLRREHS